MNIDNISSMQKRHDVFVDMLYDEFEDLTHDQRTERIAEAFVFSDADRETTVLAATLPSGEIAGLAAFTRKRRGCAVRLHRLYVKRRHRGRGIGRALVMDGLKRHRYMQIACEARLRPYYEKMGLTFWQQSTTPGEVVGSTTKKGVRLPIVAPNYSTELKIASAATAHSMASTMQQLGK